jgi:hypothetical protein
MTVHVNRGPIRDALPDLHVACCMFLRDVQRLLRRACDVALAYAGQRMPCSFRLRGREAGKQKTKTWRGHG